MPASVTTNPTSYYTVAGAFPPRRKPGCPYQARAVALGPFGTGHLATFQATTCRHSTRAVSPRLNTPWPLGLSRHLARLRPAEKLVTDPFRRRAGSVTTQHLAPGAARPLLRFELAHSLPVQNPAALRSGTGWPEGHAALAHGFTVGLPVGAGAVALAAARPLRSPAKAMA